MSTVAEDLDALVGSLRTYSPGAVRSAIGAARDPEKAGELVRRLEALLPEYPSKDFTATGLCVALGEAKVAAAAPLLLKTVVEDGDLVADAARYALMRMGEPAFEEVMRFIRTDPDLFAGNMAYQVLCAASDADEPVRQRVADFCVDRAPLEMSREASDDEWVPGYSVCEVLLWLKDPRVGPLLEGAVRRHPDDETYGELLASFEFDEEFGQTEPEWRDDWPDRCEELDEQLALERDDYGQEDGDGELGPYSALLQEFVRSDRGRSLSDPQLAAGMMRQLITLGMTYIDEEFSFANEPDVREVLLDLLPKKVMGGPEYFGHFPAALGAFVEFLHDRGKVQDARPLLRLAQQARTELPRRAADPANWGIAKRMFMHQGFKDELPPILGVDLDSAVRRMAKTLDVDLDAELREQPPAGVEPIKPIRRESPKVGRNDPCPCGSGKKYKKCCGGGELTCGRTAPVARPYGRAADPPCGVTGRAPGPR